MMPVAGNLAHHAIEMLLKANLAGRGISMEELKGRYQHYLKRLWKKFKELHPGTDLSEFNGVISTIHRWERIRYPDVNGGWSGLHTWRAATPEQLASQQRHSMPKYYLVMPDLDKLITAIARMSGHTAQSLKFVVLNEQAGLDVLFHDNVERAFWEGTQAQADQSTASPSSSESEDSSMPQ
jgi:hypothetical protein